VQKSTRVASLCSRLRSSGFVLLWALARGRRSLPWACINIEDSRKLIQANNVNSYPTPILVDQAGRIVSMRARGPQLERLLEKLLPEKK